MGVRRSIIECVTAHLSADRTTPLTDLETAVLKLVKAKQAVLATLRKCDGLEALLRTHPDRFVVSSQGQSVDAAVHVRLRQRRAKCRRPQAYASTEPQWDVLAVDTQLAGDDADVGSSLAQQLQPPSGALVPEDLRLLSEEEVLRRSRAPPFVWSVARRLGVAAAACGAGRGRSRLRRMLAEAHDAMVKTFCSVHTESLLRVGAPRRRTDAAVDTSGRGPAERALERARLWKELERSSRVQARAPVGPGNSVAELQAAYKGHYVVGFPAACVPAELVPERCCFKGGKRWCGFLVDAAADGPPDGAWEGMSGGSGALQLRSYYLPTADGGDAEALFGHSSRVHPVMPDVYLAVRGFWKGRFVRFLRSRGGDVCGCEIPHVCPALGGILCTRAAPPLRPRWGSAARTAARPATVKARHGGGADDGGGSEEEEEDGDSHHDEAAE